MSLALKTLRNHCEEPVKAVESLVFPWLFSFMIFVNVISPPVLLLGLFLQIAYSLILLHSSLIIIHVHLTFRLHAEASPRHMKIGIRKFRSYGVL